MGVIHLTSFIVFFDVQKIENVCVCVCVCECVCYVSCYNSRVPSTNCHSLSHSSELAPQLEVL